MRRSLWNHAVRGPSWVASSNALRAAAKSLGVPPVKCAWASTYRQNAACSVSSAAASLSDASRACCAAAVWSLIHMSATAVTSRSALDTVLLPPVFFPGRRRRGRVDAGDAVDVAAVQNLSQASRVPAQPVS